MTVSGRASAGAGFGRTALVGAAAIAALLVSWAPATAAVAQDAPPAGDGRYIDQGTAKAQATVVAVAPASGDLEFAVTSGQAQAETAGAQSAALAQSFNFGLIGSSLTGEGCDGSDPAVQPDQLPQPTKLDNRQGAASADTTEAPIAADGIGAGREQVSVDDVPSGHATVTTGDVDLAGLIAIGGGRASSDAVVLPGEGREAIGTVELNLTIAGVVELRGLRWTATHRSGPAMETQADGSFELAGASVGGIPLPLDDIAAVQDAVNTALAPTGLRVEFPQVEHISDPVDIVRVSPLRLLIDNSPIGAAGVRPALDLTRDARSQLFDALAEADCNSEGLLLVGEILLGTPSGTGSLVAELGGSEAATATVIAQNAFGDAPPPLDGGATPPAPVSPAAPGAGPTRGGPAVPAAPVVQPAPANPVLAPAVALGPPYETCESTHPNRAPACSVGAAGVVGLVGLGATAGVAVLDLRRRRAASNAAAVAAGAVAS
jgi:hypothetical protein